MTTNDSIHQLAGLYALHALDDVESLRFERHLRDCAECELDVAGMQSAAAALGAAEATDYPQRMKASVLEAASRTRQLPPLAPRRTPRVQQRWLGVAAAAVLVVAVGAGALVGVVVGRARPGASTGPSDSAGAAAVAQLLTAADARVVPLRSTAGGHASVVVSASLGGAAVVASDMPAAPGGHVYEAWYVDAAGRPVAAGTFTPAVAGPTTVPLVGSPGVATTVAVTVEPAGGSTAPTTTPVMTASLV